ncbi:MAG: hypothetical protein RIS64_1676 [Bacteroidota bacterium]|jgi:small subunit ribosomal protein S2
MEKPSYNELLDAGVHFGHQRRKWNPKMLPYIFTEHKGIHLIDLNRTSECLERAGLAMRQIAKSGRKVLFVATKKQSRELVKAAALSVGMPFVTDRWLGGMMTNFQTVRKSVKTMNDIDRKLSDETNTSINKKEKLTMGRERDKIEKVLGGIANMTRLPAAVFIVDIGHEHLALAEAKRLGLKTFGMVDTNCDPNTIDFPIPANDDASKSVGVITNYLIGCMREGLEERNKGKESKEGARS